MVAGYIRYATWHAFNALHHLVPLARVFVLCVGLAVPSSYLAGLTISPLVFNAGLHTISLSLPSYHDMQLHAAALGQSVQCGWGLTPSGAGL